MVGPFEAPIEGAHNALLDLEELDDAEIEHIRRDYRKLAEEARNEIEKGMKDTDCRDVVHEMEEKAEEVEEKAEQAKKSKRASRK